MVAVLLVLVVVDRVAVGIAEDQIAKRIQTSQDLADRPEVDVAGFPFLTQVIRGRYKQVTVDVRGLTREDLRLGEIHIVAEGVHVDLGDLLSGAVNSVPVDHARGSVLIDYDDLNAYLDRRVNVPKVEVSRGGSGNLRVTGSVEIPILGRSLSLSGDAKVAIDGENITLLPTAVTAVTGFLPGFAQESAREALTVRFALRNLPFGVRLDQPSVTDDGIRISAFADGLTLDTQHAG